MQRARGGQAGGQAEQACMLAWRGGGGRTRVVPGPDGAHALRPGEESAGQHKGAVAVLAPLLKPALPAGGGQGVLSGREGGQEWRIGQRVDGRTGGGVHAAGSLPPRSHHHHCNAWDPPPLPPPLSSPQPISRSHVVIVAVDVVHGAVLVPPVVQVVLGHRDLRGCVGGGCAWVRGACDGVSLDWIGVRVGVGGQRTPARANRCRRCCWCPVRRLGGQETRKKASGAPLGR